MALVQTLTHPLVIDFDSTLVTCEALDMLAARVLADDPDRISKIEAIEAVTRAGMEGAIGIDESLERRLALLSITRTDLDRLAHDLVEHVSPSFQRNRAFLRDHVDAIHVVSSGFEEYIGPVVESLGLRTDHVHANTFRFSDDGRVIGFDRRRPTARPEGKVEAVRAIVAEHGIDGQVDVIGDGMTDWETTKSGAVHRFYAFAETVERPAVVDVADRVIRSFDEYLWLNRLPGATSFPRSRIDVLLLENIHADARAALDHAGFSVNALADAMTEDELIERIGDVSILGIRSKTRVTARVLEHADRLLGIGCFCIGTDQVDLAAAAARGIPVFNAPYANTRSVVELAIGEMIMLIRRIPDADRNLQAGRWRKSARGSHELRGKRLGIVGYGAIGSQLSVLAEAMGLEVVYHDLEERLTMGNARRATSLRALLEESDIVTVHVDGRGENASLFGDAEFECMKEGAIFLNLARGSVVDLEALRRAIRSGRLGGASVDVYPSEPTGSTDSFESPVQGLPNVILTPHIGGSTAEAQANIGAFVAQRLTDWVNAGVTPDCVNLPRIISRPVDGAHRILHLHRNVPGILAKINGLCAEHGLNVLGQHLRTTGEIGFVVLDVDSATDDDMIEALRAIPETIRVRVLY